jgi:GAF domain-containing protein/anti-sigma regulatory factor (Ser/Thr protein kinase)
MVASSFDDLTQVRRIEELTAELSKARAQRDEALQQQATTADILKVISGSAFDLQRVLDTLVESATRLCDADMAQILRPKAEAYYNAASYGFSPEYMESHKALTFAPGRGSLTGRVLLDGKPVQIPDVLADPEYTNLEPQRLGGYRTHLGVPLLRDGNQIGVILVSRRTVRPFDNKQIELVRTFADQAVIAIENTRLFEAEQASKHELQQSLEYQTAISDVLGVISRSPNHLQPVLDAIVETAFGLCPSDGATIMLREADRYRFVASAGFTPEEITDRKERAPVPVDRGSVVGRVALEGRTIHVHDVKSDPNYTLWPSGFRRDRRTVLGVPLVRDGSIAGVIILFRTEVEPYSQRQIELVETFANQAVIAMNNARLFEAEQASKRELQEALEYQTATSEVLNVISRSPNQLQPVFDFIARSASRLCGDEHAIVTRYDSKLLHLAAQHNPRPGIADAQASFYPREPHVETSISGRAFVHAHLVHIPDIDTEQWEHSAREGYRKMGLRAAVAVPMMRDGRPIGVIGVSRGTPGAFSDRQIQLLKTFADQAVIAIENTRLFEAEQVSKRDLQESLEYQTAISDVLGVISRSQFDLQPVLQSVVETAARLCRAHNAIIYRLEAAACRFAAGHGHDAAAMDLVRATPHPINSGTVVGRAIAAKETVQIEDVLADPLYTVKELAKRGNVRSVIGVPLMRGGDPIGAIALGRSRVEPFNDREIELVTTFADQAVIAIENTRLFEAEQASKRELQESLEYQTASSEVLGVISQSPSRAQPVFEAIVATSRRLCQAEYALICRLGDDGRYHLAAHSNVHQSFLAWLRANPCAAGDGSAVGLVALQKLTIHMPDALSDPRFSDYRRQRESRARTMLTVPLLKGGSVIGVIWLARSEVKPFTDRQVDLVTTFANQAVIAINNAGLFEEVQARNRDLTALSEVGRAVSSTLDLKVVLRTIVDRAVTLSGTDAGSIFYFREDIGQFELGETTGLDEDTVVRFRKLDIAAGQTGLGEAISSGKPLQVADITKRPSNALRDAAIEAGLRAALIVPLLSGEEPLGALVLQRRQPGEFPDAVVSLMQSFADQSAIALENARLFNEIAQKSRELEIASQHKSQFVANMSHELRTPLAAILGYAELMQEGFYEPLGQKSLDALTRIRSNGKHLLGLINTVLDIAKIESGQFTLNMAEYAIESVVETVRSATESLAQNKKLVLKTDVAKSLPIGLGDEQRLTQVLLNLVGNAIKFTDVGEVRVTAKAVNGHFNVSVTDTGPGIPEQERTRIFDQFHQVDSSLTKAKGGTGLGLAIAKQIVEMHGGRIWVESMVGKGSTFQMELPTRAKPISLVAT